MVSLMILQRQVCVANPNKRKGDAAERAVRDYLSMFHPTKKTRAGFDDDLGDVLTDTPAGRLVVQVKDVASPKWKEWYTQLGDQVQVCADHTENIDVLGGVIVHKYRGHANPEQWHTVTQLGSFMQLLQGAYEAGYKSGLKE